MLKLISSVVAVTTFITASLNSFIAIPKTMATSYRTTYKIYGDLNSDNRIDIYDVVSMRKEIVKGTYNKSLDFNCDDAVDSADLTLLNDYVLGKNSFFDAYLYDDADEDSVCDMFEIAILESDPDSKDTDGDTLSDFDEVVYTNTSPTNKYTRGLAVTDADDDTDDDKLTNKEEISAKTNSKSDDSDMDGINDYDELNKYNTDPNNEDSDNDSIIDGDEIKLGLKPDSHKSDGQTPDNQRAFENKISASNKLLSHINTEDSPYEVSIDIKSAGNIEKALSIKTGSFSNTSEDDHFIGKSLAISYTDNLTVETAKIYFKPDTIEGNIENYMIFEFFPETNYLLPVETKYTSDSAYVETNELGTFTLVKIKDSSQLSNSVKMAPYNILAAENSDKSVGKNDVVYDYELGALEVAFFVDISGTLTDNLEETKKSIHDCSQAIFEHSDNAYVEIIGYYTAPDLSTKKLIGYDNSEGDLLLSNIDSVDAALENLSPYTSKGNNDLNYVIWDIEALKDDLFSNDNSQKYAFIISNSDYSFTTSLGYKVTIPNTVCESFETIHDSNIHLNFLLSKEIFNNKTAVNNLKDACKPYNFGVYSNLETGYFGNTGFARIYSDAITDIFKESICYISTLTPQTIPTEVNRNAFSNSLPSSYDKSKIPAADANGNINFKDAAVKIGAAYYNADGNLVFQSMLDACSGNELTRIGYEQYMKNRSVSERLISGSLQITPFTDKIFYKDTDGDGIPDCNDPKSEEPFDDRFMLVDMLNYIPNIDFVDRHIAQSEKCAYSKLPNPIDLSKFEALCILADGGFLTGGLPAIQSISGWTDNFEYISSVKFAQFLSQFLWGRGKTLALSNNEMYSIIFEAKRNREHYSYNINQMRKAVEGIVTSDNNSHNKVYITTKPKSLFKAACYKAHGCYAHTGYYYDDATAGDWGYSLGEAMCAMTAEAYKTNDKYCMRIRYYIIDNYEFAVHWEAPNEPSGLDRAGHRMHETGLANEYKVIGVYEDFITWNLGETLYPNDYIDIELDEDRYNAGPTN